MGSSGKWTQWLARLQAKMSKGTPKAGLSEELIGEQQQPEASGEAPEAVSVPESEKEQKPETEAKPENPPPWRKWLARAQDWVMQGDHVVWVIVAVAALSCLGLLVVPISGDVVMTNAVIFLEDGDFLSTGSFQLTGDAIQSLDEEYLRENLDLGRDVSFRVTKEDSRTATVEVEGDREREYTVSLPNPHDIGTLRWVVNEALLTATVLKSEISSQESLYLSFSEPVDEQVLYRNLYISPSVPYQVYVTGNLAEIRFYGANRKSSLYTVYLDRFLTSESGKMLGRDMEWDIRIGVQRDTAKRGYSAELTNPEAQILTAGDDIVLEFLTAGRSWPTVAAMVSAYRFDDFEDYMERAGEMAALDLSLDGIMEKATAEIHLLSHGLSQVSLPNPGPGGYLIDASFENPLTGRTERFRKTVMVTDLSVYIQTVMGESLVWVNNSISGLAVPGYTVEFIDPTTQEVMVSGVTDADGIAMIHSPEYDREVSRPSRNTVMLRNGEGAAVYADNTTVLNNSYYQPTERFYSYFYMDRAIYKPTDEISFWGYVQPYRGNETTMPGEVKIVLEPDGLAQTVTATVDSNNTFYGTLPLDQVKSSNYRISAILTTTESQWVENEDDESEEGEGELVLVETETDYILKSAYIEVKEYQKPRFQVSTSVDKEYYGRNDDVTVEIIPKFYDGTPLPNYEMAFTVFDSYYGSASLEMTAMTDENGVATVSFPAFQAEGKEHVAWKPSTNRYRVRIAADGEDIVQYGTYLYFPVDLIVTNQVERVEDTDDQFEIQVQTNTLVTSGLRSSEDLDALQSVNYYYYDDSENYDDDAYDILRGAARDVTVKLDVTFNYYNSRGEYTNRTESYTLDTENGSATQLIRAPRTADMSRYFRAYVVALAEDGNGTRVRYASYYYNGRSTYRNDEEVPEYYRGYHLAATNGENQTTMTDFNAYKPYDEAIYNDGDTINLRLMHGLEEAENNGKLLYTVIQDGVIQRGFTGGNTLQFTQTVQWANNVTIVAAYFDGAKVIPVRDLLITMVSDSIRLEVEVTPDKAEYFPGDTVTLQVQVNDWLGRGVAGTTLLSVVDESVFALREQYITLLRDLYSTMHFYNYYVRKYTTTDGDYNTSGMGEGGKGNDPDVAFYDAYRQNFRDTALFRPVRTNSSGAGSVSFTLPDNVTSWRVTALSIGDNLYAGQSESNFVSTMPFFINPILSEKYIEGDDVAMVVQAYGTLLDEDSDVTFTVGITGDGVDETITADNQAYQSQLINFGQLPMGEYTLVATAQYSGYSDTVEVPVTVVTSSLELVVNKELDLSQPLDISAMRYPVTISFYDQEHNAYYKSLSSLLKHYCNIANQRMSRYVAKQRLIEYMDTDQIPRYILDTSDNLADMQNRDGGIAYYSGNNSQVLLSTRVSLLAAEQFNQTTLISYFNKAIDQYSGGGSREEQPNGEEAVARELVAASYLGLAHLGEEVADQVRALLKDDKATVREQAYLIAALAEAGEADEALREYNSRIAPLVKVSGNGRYVQIDSEAGDSENQIATAAAWVAAILLEHDHADDYALYFSSSRWQISTLFECMLYVAHYSREIEDPIAFTYTANGVQQAVNLGIEGQKSISLGRSEVESLELGALPDRLQATAYYIGEPDEVDFIDSELIQLEKTITPQENNRHRVEVTLSLSDDAPTGLYDIYDWIPSNMRMYELDRENYSSGDGWYFRYTNEGQKLAFTVNVYDAEEREIKLVYYIQEVYESQAMVDSTYVIHGDSGENTRTQRYRW